jgi:hypothetical protein
MAGYKSDSAQVTTGESPFVHCHDLKSCEDWGSFSYGPTSSQLRYGLNHKQQGEDALAGQPR